MKLTNLILSASVAAMALVSCNKQETTPQNESSTLKTVQVSLENVIFTKGVAGPKVNDGDKVIVNSFQIFMTDASGNEYKVVSAIEGQGTAAQLSLVMGSDAGGLAHPRWMENLKLAVALQEHLLTQHPTLMRPMLLRGSRYNQHTTTGSLLVEVGAAGNSPDEAILAARLFARSMAGVLTAPQ